MDACAANAHRVIIVTDMPSRGLRRHASSGVGKRCAANVEEAYKMAALNLPVENKTFLKQRLARLAHKLHIRTTLPAFHMIGETKMRPLRVLLSNVRIKFGVAAAIVGVLGLVAAPLANATPVSFYNDAATPTTVRYTLGCGSASGSCSGLLEVLESESPYSFDSSVGDLFSLGSSGIGTETSFVKTATGQNFATGTQVDGSGSNHEFSTSAEYFLIKTGQGGGPPYALIHNLSGSSLDLYFEAQTTGTGFSHFTEFGPGTTTAVPEPKALGMLGFGVLLVGVFAGLRRRYS